MRSWSVRPFAIAQVTPYPWEQHHEVNRFVERLSDEFARRGHRVVVVAPSDSRELIREARATVRRCATIRTPCSPTRDARRVLAVGAVAAVPRGGAVSLPLDVSRTLEDLLERAELDFLHVHEPFAPSAASAALRHSRALNVGTFHAATERLLSTQMARQVVELLFGRLDGRTASFAATRDLIERYFPGEYSVIHPGADPPPRWTARGEGPPEIVFSDERSAARCGSSSARSGACRRDLDWRATIWLRDPAAAPAPALSRRLRERVRLAGPADGSEAQHLARRTISVAASAGTAPAPQLVLRAHGGRRGARGVAASGVRGAGARRRARTAVRAARRAHAGRPARAAAVATRSSCAGTRARSSRTRPELDWSRVADEFEELYERIAARRHDDERQAAAPPPAGRARLRARGPPHAHRPLARLRDAGRHAARHGEERRPGRDRHHRPQRDLGRARGARAGRTASR